MCGLFTSSKPAAAIKPSSPESRNRATIDLIFAAHALARRHRTDNYCLECAREGILENPATHTGSCLVGNLYAKIARLEGEMR